MRTVESAGTWLLAAAATLALTPAAAQPVPRPAPPSIAVSVRQPRAFGYLIGDELTQRISLRAPAGFVLDPKSLPQAGRKGLWLKLTAPRITSASAGDATRYLLTLDYQVINVPDHVRTIDLPALDLAFSGHGGKAGTIIDEWPVTISPITPTYVLARAGLTQTQPDARPPTTATGTTMRLTLLWAAAFIALNAGLILRRRAIPWLRRDARPFARAAHDLAKLSRLPPDRATYRRGLQRLHRAFDAAAGHAVFGDVLPHSWSRAPSFSDCERTSSSSMPPRSASSSALMPVR
ncbi:MAG: hypothetical protein ACRETZ_09310 [Steroidobacteraceae bacterium]